MNRLHVKPAAPGLIVRDPVSRLPLPEEGGLMPDTSYWRRRIEGGDVELLEEVSAEEMQRRAKVEEEESKAAAAKEQAEKKLAELHGGDDQKRGDQ